MNKAAIEKIVVLGSGLPLYTAAVLLAANLRHQKVSITAVNLRQDNFNEPVLSTGPEMLPICEMTGLALPELIKSADGTFNLGTSYNSNDRSWFVPFGTFGLKQGAGIEKGILKYATDGKSSISFADFSVAAQAANSFRFAIAGQKHPELTSALDYGVNLAVESYTHSLTGVCRGLGVECIDESVIIAIRQSEPGCITELTFSSGKKISADFWIDGSGQLWSLAQYRSRKTLGCWGKQSKSIYFSSRFERRELVPAVIMRQCPWGWLKATSLRKKNIYEFLCENPVAPDETKHWLEDNDAIDVEYLGQKAHDLGRLEEVWEGNCLAIGDAAVNFGSSVYTELTFVQSAMVMFLDLYPNSPAGAVDRKWFNRSWNNFIDEAEEFCALHAIALEPGLLENSDFELPDGLLKRIKLFSRLGRIGELDSDAVLPQRWYAMLFGMGFRPELSDMSLNFIDEQQLFASMEKTSQSIKNLANGMPFHRDYLNRYF